jgi:hypothetical protein
VLLVTIVLWHDNESPMLKEVILPQVIWHTIYVVLHSTSIRKVHFSMYLSLYCNYDVWNKGKNS